MAADDASAGQLLAAGDDYRVWYTPGGILIRGAAVAVTVDADGERLPYYRTADVLVPASAVFAAAAALGPTGRPRS